MSSNPPRLIRIAIVTDFVCAFSYIGNEVLKAAMRKCEQEDNVTFNVEFRPFQLYMESNAGIPRVDHLKKRMGDRYESVNQMVDQMVETYKIPKILRHGVVGSSYDAHRLCHKAYLKGGQELQTPVVEDIFVSYFGTTQSMDQPELVKIAVKNAVFDSDSEAEAFFASDESKAEVTAGIEFARKAGIKGVPFTVIENKWAISGVQQEDTFVQIFKKLAKCTGSTESCPGTPSLASLALPTAAVRVSVQ